MTVTAPTRPNDPIEFQEPEADVEALIEEARQRARRRRRMYGAVVAVLALVGVAVTVFGRAAQSHPTATTLPSGAVPSAGFQSDVRIDLTGRMFPSRGEFTLSGAINDRGTFADDGGFHLVRTLRGGSGTIRITVGPQGRWKIIEGTKAYAGLHGQGGEAGLYSDTIDITMSGTVSQ